MNKNESKRRGIGKMEKEETKNKTQVNIGKVGEMQKKKGTVKIVNKIVTKKEKER